MGIPKHPYGFGPSSSMKEDCGAVWDPESFKLVKVDGEKFLRRSVDQITVENNNKPIKKRLFKKGSLLKVKSFCELSFKATANGELYTDEKELEKNRTEEIGQGRILTLLDEGLITVTDILIANDLMRNYNSTSNLDTALRLATNSTTYYNGQKQVYSKILKALKDKQKKYITKHGDEIEKENREKVKAAKQASKILLRYFKFLINARPEKDQDEKPFVAYTLKYSHFDREYAENYWFDVIWEPDDNESLIASMKEKDFSGVIFLRGKIY